MRMEAISASEIRDSNLICDGLVFPDRTPSPGLIEFKMFAEPIRIGSGDGNITIRNVCDFADLSAYAFSSRLESEGKVVAEGSLDVPNVIAHESVSVALPKAPLVPGYWFVTARLAKSTQWARAGHEVAWGQFPAAPAQQTVTRSAAYHRASRMTR